MKLILLLALLTASGWAADVNLAWDDAQSGVTYNVYEQQGPTAAKIGTSTAKTFAVKNITSGQHSYFVTAAIGSLESQPSNIVILPGAVTNLRATITISVP